ncbi:MAG: FAD-dependent oxidoreductase [Actinobacteria bacterium]|nr:FAD-dependent oxidoreductase [Actinomycetota bacterium]
MILTDKEIDEIYDCVIIGAGPAGMTAAIFAKAKNMRVLILEGNQAGGQLKNLYPYKPVYNYPGYSRIPAGELADRMIEQVREYNIPLMENSPIKDIVKSDENIFVISGKQFRVKAKSIVLASGLGLSEPRRVGAPGESELEGNGIEYTITNIADWTGKDVAVIGGGNSAIDNALLLLENNARVVLIHRSQLRAEPDSIKKLQKKNVPIHLGWKPSEFQKSGNGKVLFAIENDGKKMRLEKDKILINIGLKPNTEFLEKLAVDKNNKHILVDTEMHTSIPGIFGCGDAITYPGKVRLIVTALGEAATAVNSLQNYLKSLQIPQKEVS